MIKKQQKWIALLVTLTFAWLLQVSTMPLSGADAAEQITAAQAGQAPDFVEQEDSGGNQPRKKSILPVVLIGVGVVAVAAVLFLVVLKTSYDIRGDWNISRIANGSTYIFTVKFIGEKTSGSFDAQQSGNLLHGTYTADGKTVVWTFESGSMYSGAFTDKDAMSGDYLKYDGVTTGTWTATRAGAATTVPTAQTQESEIDRD